MPRVRADGKRRQGLGDFGRRRVQHRRSRLAKLPLAAIAPKRADGRDPMPARRDHVVLAIAPHATIAGLESLALENMDDQIALVLIAAAELPAVYALEMAPEVELPQDPR